MGNAPKLRFEGFTDAWEQRKLSSVVVRVTRKNTNLESSLPLTISAEFGLVDQITYFNNRVASDNISNYYLVKNGEFAYNKSSSDGYPFGTIKRLDLYEMGVLSTLYIVFAIKESQVDSDFLATYFDTDNWHKHISECAAEGARNHGLLNISVDDFLDLTLVIPKNKEEQAQIGSYLKQLDTLITLHQRKCDALTKAKTFYLQNLFPQEREKEPKLRLEGFTDSWNPYTLGDLYTERNERGNETLQILTVSIHTGVSDGALEEDELGKSVRRSEDKTLYKHVYAGDLIFNMMRAWQGAIGVAKREGMISPAYISAIPDERVYPPFMNYLLRRKEIISQINNLSYGVTDFRKRLYWDSFIKVKCSLPSVEEQKCITDVFEQLDTLITRQEHKIKALKTIKKFMLQNMFPQEG